MVLFTKEVFLQLKTLINLHINVNAGAQYPGQPPTPPQWQVYIQGMSDSGSGVQTGYEQFSTYITTASREDAYRIYEELMKQVVDSGEVPKMNDTLFEDVLKEK